MNGVADSRRTPLPLPASSQGGFAWSGSDSDDDCLGLLGVAIDGAVSPGYESEAEREEEQRRARWAGGRRQGGGLGWRAGLQPVRVPQGGASGIC